MSYSDDEVAALLDASRHHWERRRPPEACQHCNERPPVWLVLDPKRHTYVEESRDRRQMDAYLLCEGCMKKAQTWAKRGQRPRSLKRIRWSVEAWERTQSDGASE